MQKNPTPRTIAIYAAAFISLSIGALGVIFGLICPFCIHWPFLALLVFLIFILGYAAFSYALKRFIYRKIKLIYKTIHSLKSPNKSMYDRLDLHEDIIGDVNQEVIDWAEDQRSEIAQLKRMEQYRKEYIGNVSHELKTPVFNIQGYLNTLLDGGIEDKNINVKYLKKADKNLDRLIDIIEDLETISQFESGQLRLELSEFDINELVKEIFEFLEMPAEAQNIELSIKPGCDKPFIVEGDKARIRQVLINLISNSIKYGRESGRTQVGFYDMDKHILIEVSDNGIGISEDDLPRVFERFFRVDKSRSRAKGGTGLGLAIVKHIIEAHQQTINVRSRQRLGSTFGFTLTKK